MNLDFKKDILPHLLAVFIFWLATALYFQPAVFSGKSLKQSDAVTWSGNAQEIQEHRNKYHEEPLWTNSMFSGMPAYTISVIYSGELLEYVENISRWFLPYPISIVFVSLICFYVFCIALQMSPVAAVFGAFAFTLFSFTMVSMEAGHNSKVRAMTLAPLVLAGMVYAFRRKWLLALTLVALGTAMQIRSGHYQISYYLGFIVLIYGVSEFIYAIINKSFKDFSMAIVVLALGGALGVASNAGRLLTLLEYSPYSMRGKPELTIKDVTNPKTADWIKTMYLVGATRKWRRLRCLFHTSMAEAVQKQFQKNRPSGTSLPLTINRLINFHTIGAISLSPPDRYMPVPLSAFFLCSASSLLKAGTSGGC